MPELEIHHETEGGHDRKGQQVGMQAALLAVVLAIVTILSHRAHTDAVLLKASANDKWQHYQAVRVKFHNIEIGADLLGLAGGKGDASARLAEYEKGKAKYEKQAADIQEEAKATEEQAERIENRALRYDLGEGLLEIALVLSSLYFIARRGLFPAVGLVAGVVGAAIALTGALV